MGNDFVVVHNGILTNYYPLKCFLEKQGYTFESETDTECIPILLKYLWDNKGEEELNFLQLVERCIQQLEGAFAIIVKVSLTFLRKLFVENMKKYFNAQDFTFFFIN